MRRRFRRRQTWALFGFTPEEGFDLSLRAQVLAFLKFARYQVGLVVDFILLVSLWLVRRLMSVPWQTAIREHLDRDSLEIPLIREAIARGLPVLGICRGMQLINVCLGGSLHQEISVFYGETPILTTLLPRKRILISSASRLRSIVRTKKLHVNSLHYQSVRTLGAGLIAVATESNGIIQAIEHTGAPFILGVQWHPEYLAFEKPTQQRLFQSLINSAHLYLERPAVAALLIS